MPFSFEIALLDPLGYTFLDSAEPDDNLQTDTDSSLVRSSKDLRGRSNPAKLGAAKKAKSSELQESGSKVEQPEYGDPGRDPEVGVGGEDEGEENEDEGLQHRMSGSAEASPSEPPSKHFSYLKTDTNGNLSRIWLRCLSLLPEVCRGMHTNLPSRRGDSAFDPWLLCMQD